MVAAPQSAVRAARHRIQSRQHVAAGPVQQQRLERRGVGESWAFGCMRAGVARDLRGEVAVVEGGGVGGCEREAHR